MEKAALANGLGFGVHERVVLKGDLSDTEQLRLRRAAGFCPVGQMFTKGSLQLTEQVRFERASSATASGVEAQSATWLDNVEVPPGIVRSQYLIDSKEYVDGAMTDEGEVKLYLGCGEDEAPGRWVQLGGHSSQAWIPTPVGLAVAGLAASIATTLDHALRSAGSDARVRVELDDVLGARTRSQADAAEGVFRGRPVVLTAILSGPSAPPEDEVLDALRRDPLLRLLREGSALLSEEIVVG